MLIVQSTHKRRWEKLFFYIPQKYPWGEVKERKVLAEKGNKQSSNIECYAHPKEWANKINKQKSFCDLSLKAVNFSLELLLKKYKKWMKMHFWIKFTQKRFFFTVGVCFDKNRIRQNQSFEMISTCVFAAALCEFGLLCILITFLLTTFLCAYHDMIIMCIDQERIF